jgi:hypothetical protein
LSPPSPKPFPLEKGAPDDLHFDGGVNLFFMELSLLGVRASDPMGGGIGDHVSNTCLAKSEKARQGFSHDNCLRILLGLAA